MAKAAGVSAATVDRALHHRGGVSPSALSKISEAVQKLGFGERTDQLIQQTRPKLALRFILPSGGGGFIQNLKQELKYSCAQVADAEVSVAFREVEMSPRFIINQLEQAQYDGVDALGLFGVDTISVRDAVDRIFSRGTPVVTIVSDVPAAHRTTFVGIDNAAAGRTAARLMGKFIKQTYAEVAVIAGAMEIRDHMERFFAFRDLISHDYRNITILPVFETNSLDRYNLECVQKLLNNSDLAGIYLVTGGLSGVLAALRERGARAKPTLIAHDITTVSRRGLISGEIDAIINQDARTIAKTVVSNLLAKLIPGRALDSTAKACIEIDIYLAENLP